MNGQEKAVEQGAGVKVVVEVTVQDIVQDTNQDIDGTVMVTTVIIRDLDNGTIIQKTSTREGNMDITYTKNNSILEILIMEGITIETRDTQEDSQQALDPDPRRSRIEKKEKKRLKLKHTAMKPKRINAQRHNKS